MSVAELAGSRDLALPAITTRRRNWPLAVGSLVVLAVIFLAVAGPHIAPRDPLQENFIVRIPNGIWVKRPFPPLVVPGFPLGTDEFGRDLLSRILWGVRPTLTLVVMVAAIRLVAGVVVGLVSGWSVGRFGRALDTVISAALAAPVLFVALCVIAGFGSRAGIWAFVIGLSLTGWADSARLLREQTRNVKGQPYIEAARALGMSPGQVLFSHVFPQVVPLVWMQMAFETSGALLTTAALGFLGYFINSVWLPHGDWTVIRASGAPELGQMMAISAHVQTQPWGIAFAGAMVVLTVLGFNLLGEGLQPTTEPGWGKRPVAENADLAARARDRVGVWVDGVVFDPLSPWRRRIPLGLTVGSILIFIIGGARLLLRSQEITSAAANLAIPGGALWPDSRHDPYGTYWANVSGPKSPEANVIFQTPNGIVGGPVIAADGTLYLTSNDGVLHALDPRGNEQWQASLGQTPIGAPALGATGDIFVADESGGVSDFSSGGELLWRADAGGDAVPIGGPLVAPNGSIYLPLEGKVLALTSDGKKKWEANLGFYSFVSPWITADPSGKYVFFDDVALDAATGALLSQRTTDPFDRLFVGTDGRTYLGGGGALLLWQATPDGVQAVPYLHWDTVSLSIGARVLQAAGIMPGDRTWLYFSTQFDFPKLVLVDGQGQVQSFIDYPYSPALLIGLDRESHVYVCGGIQRQGGECRAFEVGSREPLWKAPLDRGVAVVGGALVEGRLYVATGEGTLYAIEDASAAK